jgi:polyhydroxyalkanoate synthase
MAAMMWLGSRAALPSLKSGSAPWKGEWASQAAALAASLEHVKAEDFAAAIDSAACREMAGFMAAVSDYRRHPYRRARLEPPVLWREGATRLLDYGEGPPGPGGGAPVLVVPSMINRAYVLDLAPGNSLMRHLAGLGMNPYLVDWGRPGPEEAGLTLTDAIAGRLERALDAVSAAAGGRKVALLGYCMGGTLALALALRRRADLSTLVLLAAPWDFHAENADRARAVAAAAMPFLPLIDRLGAMPVDLIQTMFAGLDPLLAMRKFAAFARMEPNSARSESFVALEDWLNDGTELPARVARECLLGWYGENTPGRGEWRIDGTPVRPEELDLPTLAVVPAGDRIVPPASALALAERIPDAERLEPDSGHIGMVVGGHAREAVWAPLADWLGARA